MKKLFRLFSFPIIIAVMICANPGYVNARELTNYNGEIIELIEPDESWVKITISSASEFAAFSRRCRIDAESEKLYVELENDISFYDEEFSPVPYFKGIFDGNGHTVSGVTCVNTSEPVGLFSTIGEGGLVKDLKVTGVLQSGENCNNMGGVCGKNSGIIFNCSFEGVVAGNNYIGGIAGENCEGGIIAGCSSSGAMRGDNMVGGIAGVNSGSVVACKNYALINTESVDTGIDIANLDVDFTLDLANLSSQGASSMKDMGGICGYSNGTVFDCANSGEIGYNHQGYNVGGIVGRSSGYIYKCKNDASIYGRKDIGGIVGQMEPYVEVKEAESRISILNNQIKEMQELMETTRNHAYNAGSDATKRIDNILELLSDAQGSASDISQNLTDDYESATSSSAKEKAESASQFVKDNINEDETDKKNIDDIKQDQDDLDNTLTDINKELELLNNEAKGYGNELDADLDRINDKYSEIMDTFESFKDVNLGIEDTSSIDPDLIVLGAVKGCTNNGSVEGDLNVAGIAGAMGQESSLDPEDEISLSIDFDTYKEYEYKDVVINCVNFGSVYTKRNYAGGITSRAEIGYIRGCENYGAIEAEGNYAGGIAAESCITIENCYSKGFLSAVKHVGGIIGAGVDESENGSGSVVSGCRSYVTIENASKFYGAVSGSTEGEYDNNIFASDTLMGLGAYSVDGKAYPVSYEKLMEGNDVPSEFKKITVSFWAGDVQLKSLEVDYLDDVSSDMYPSIPSKNGCFAHWDIEEISKIKCDTKISVIYSDFIAAIASEDARLSGRPIFYAEGDFSDEDALSVKQYSNAEITVEEYENDSFTSRFYYREVEEYWKVEIPADGRSVHTLRYLPTGTSSKTPEIYIKENGQFVKTEITEIGSYYSFETSEETVEIVVVATRPVYYTFAIAFASIIATLVIISFVISIIRKIKKRKKKAAALKKAKETEEAKEAEASDGEDKELSEDDNAEKEDKEDKEEINDQESINSDSEESDKAKEAPKPKKKKHKVFRSILKIFILLLLAAVVSLTVYLAKNPEIVYGKIAYLISMRAANMDNLSFDAEVTLSVGGETEKTEAHVNVVKTDNRTFTKFETNGAVLYKCENRLYLENGKAFELSGDVPSYEMIFSMLPEIIEDTTMGAERVDGGIRRSFALSNEKANEVMKKVLGEYSSQISSVENTSIILLTGNWTIKTATVKGTVILKSGERAVVECVMNINSDEEAPVIPSNVIDMAASGEPALTITPDMLELVYAFGRFNTKSPAVCDVSVIAKGSALTLNSNLSWFRVKEGEDWINCVTKNGVALYYNDNGACTSKGVSLSDSQKEVVETVKLLDTAYDLCMKGDLDTAKENESITYSLDINAEDMEAVFETMAPEMIESDTTLTSGTVRVTVENGEISEISISIVGKVKIAKHTKPFSVTVKVNPTTAKSYSDYKIPTEVMATLNGK